MNVLIDTNVVLDLLLQREPYFVDAARVNVLSEKGFISAYISASAATDIYYIARKETRSKEDSLDLIKTLLRTIHIATVTESNILEALDLKWDDFEDSVQYVVGKSISAEYIITRNAADYSESHVNVLSPKEFIQLFAAEETNETETTE